MFETVVFISLIVGFVLVTVFSMAGMILMRRRDQESGGRNIAEHVAKIDEAADAALAEINKTAALVSEEVNEKYQSMLFLYTLLEDKKKEVIALSETGIHDAKKQAKAEKMDMGPGAAADKKSRPSVTLNPKHDEIMQLAEVGFSAGEIAKELNMGQGEVRLILDLAKLD